ncbi:hypothetical protein [Kribbella sp. NPDC048915]|uniref:hypothetical protein n=1 Tax=Kribbella sp. NPDC048915 TaxID=3155148 RepID=UPI0033F8F1E9
MLLMKPLPMWIDDRSREEVASTSAEKQLITFLVPRSRSITGGSTKLLGFADNPGDPEPQSFRDRVLHIPVMITTTGGRVRIQLDASICYMITVAAVGPD